jgi:RNA polymerase sigma-70 factor (ECF subfamily)
MFSTLTHSDARLVRQVLSGRRDRFAPLVERHQSMVQAVAFAYTGNRADAEDVVQDAFLKAFQSLSSLREPNRFGPWVATITRRAASDYRKQRARQATVPETDETVEPNVEERDMEALLRRQMERLEPEQREILLLRYYAGKSVKEVAAALEIKPDAAAKRLQRAREALGERLIVALGESREDREQAGNRVARVMGAVAGTTAVWQASATASAGAGFGALLGSKTVIGLSIATVVVALSWTAYNARRSQYPFPLREPVTVGSPTEETPREKRPIDEGAVKTALVGALQSVTGSRSERGAVTGRVYDRDTGDGIPGAMIRVSPQSLQDMPRGLETTTNEDGAYRLEGLVPGRYDLRLDPVDGYSERITWDARPLAVGAGATVANLDFALVGGCVIRGTVVDEDGKPLSPGSVRAWTPNGQYEGSGTIREDGTFTVGGVPETDRVLVQPVKSGYALAPQGPFELPPDGIQDLVLTMGPEATLSGVVVNGDGVPIEGAQIDPSPGPGQCSGISCEPSDPEGRFTVHGLFPAEYRISVKLPHEDVYMRLENLAPISIEMGEHIEGVELVCARTQPGNLTLAGRVINAEGAPIRGVDVVAERPGWNETRTYDDGSFRIEGLRDLAYDLYVWHRNYAPQRLSAVSPGKTDLIIQLEPRGSIEGRVVDASTGAPVTEFEILEFTSRRSYNGRPSAIRFSDAEGRFNLPNVEPGEQSVQVSAAGYAPTRSQEILVLPGRTAGELIVELSRGRIIEGIVYDPDGQPAQEARIFLDKQPASGYIIQDFALAVTGDDGRFVLESVSAEATEVIAWHPRHAAARAPIPGGSGGVEMELHLRPGATLEGTVRAEGEPIPNLNVTIGDVSPSVHESQTDEAGNYRLIGLTPGTVEVVSNPTFGEAESWYGRKQIRLVEVREGEITTLDLDFDVWPTEVAGRVTVDGQPPADTLYVYLKFDVARGLSDMFYTHTDEQGYFRLDGAPPGTAVLETFGSSLGGRERPAATVTISGSQVNNLNFDIVKDANGASALVPLD